MTTRRKTLIVVAAVVAITVATAIVFARRGVNSAAAAANAKAAPATPVLVAHAVLGDVDNVVELPARVEAKSSVVIKSRIDGQIVAILAREGQPVRSGDVLFRLDAAALLAQERLAAANLSRDEAQLAKSLRDQNQNEELATKGFLSEAGLTAVRAGTDVAREGVRAENAALEGARVALGYTEVRAPFDGVAGALAVSIGQAVRANDTALLTIVQAAPVYVTAALPEARLSVVRAALNDGDVPVAVDVPQRAGDEQGRIAFIDNAVDPTTGTIAVKAEVRNADHTLVPGQFVTMRLRLGHLNQVVAVPAQAVQRGPDGWFVWIAEAGKDSTAAAHVRMQTVALGELLGTQRVIEKGLAGGEEIVVEGQFRLAPGAAVRTAPANAPATADAAAGKS